MTEVWQPSARHKCIINLPATVEMSTPNVADQIEWMHRNLARREASSFGASPQRSWHRSGCGRTRGDGGCRPDRGLPLRQWRTHRQRRPVTLALNLYSQGRSSRLDFHLHQRGRAYRGVLYPVAGPSAPSLCRGSGVHSPSRVRTGRDQERLCGPAGERTLGGALSSGRPADLGRSYESIIRVNSQSGKGGIAFLLETEYGMVLPRRLQVEFSAAVQRVTDVSAAR